jgi:hypothetical protein
MKKKLSALLLGIAMTPLIGVLFAPSASALKLPPSPVTYICWYHAPDPFFNADGSPGFWTCRQESWLDNPYIGIW